MLIPFLALPMHAGRSKVIAADLRRSDGGILPTHPDFLLYLTPDADASITPMNTDERRSTLLNTDTTPMNTAPGLKLISKRSKEFRISFPLNEAESIEQTARERGVKTGDVIRERYRQGMRVNLRSLSPVAPQADAPEACQADTGYGNDSDEKGSYRLKSLPSHLSNFKT